MKKATTAMFVAGTVAGAAAGLPSEVHAQSVGDAVANLKGTVEAGVQIVPEYEGSDETEFDWYPRVDLTYADSFFVQLSKRQKIDVVGGYNVIRNPNLRIAATIGYISGREEDDSTLLTGTGDVGDAVEIGFLAEYAFDFIKVDVSGGYDISTGHDGLRGGAGVSFGARLSRQLQVQARVGANYGNADHNQSVFGINAGQAAASQFATYTPEGGINDVNFEVRADYTVAPRWGITARGEYQRFIGDAADSPLVEGTSANQGVGSESQILGSIGITYTF